jgi:hypothetical protein
MTDVTSAPASRIADEVPLWWPASAPAAALFAVLGAAVALPAAGFGLLAVLVTSGFLSLDGVHPRTGLELGTTALALAALPPVAVRVCQGGSRRTRGARVLLATAAAATVLWLAYGGLPIAG